MKSTPTQAMKPLEWLREGENLRPVIVDNSIKELCHSIVANGLIQPPSAIDRIDYGDPFIGFRRLAALRWGLAESLPVQTVIPVLLYPPTITPGEVKILQITENIQRLDLTDVQLHLAVVELETLGLARKDIASTMGVSPPTVSRWFAPCHVSEEAREHFLAGRLTLGQCYNLSIADNPQAAMAVFLKGGTRARAAQAGKPPSDVPKEKTAKIKIPLAVVNEEYTADGVVTISSLPGREIDLQGAENLLKEALRSVKEAKKNNWSPKNAMGTWRDTAAAVRSQT